jgi:hypothetical protein
MQVASVARRLALLEAEAAETRQLRDEEDALLASTVAAMGRVWARLGAARARQRVALTDVCMAVVKQPVADDTPVQQVGGRAIDLNAIITIASSELPPPTHTKLKRREPNRTA